MNRVCCVVSCVFRSSCGILLPPGDVAHTILNSAATAASQKGLLRVLGDPWSRDVGRRRSFHLTASNESRSVCTHEDTRSRGLRRYAMGGLVEPLLKVLSVG